MIRLRPDLLRRPVAVLDGTPPLEQVASLNAPARALGTRHGMTRAELDSIPGLTVLKRSLAEERTTRAALLEIASVWSPSIEIVPDPRPGATGLSVVLDMTGTSRIWGEPEDLLQKLARALRQLRLHAQLCASANVHCAVHMAAALRSGTRFVPRGAEAAALAPLPLSVLPLTAHQQQTFSLWGLRTVGELAALPTDDLVARLGPAGRQLQLFALGEHPHLLVPEEAPFLLEEQIEFDAPLDLIDSLLFVLGPMLDQLLQRARNRSLALASLTLALGLERGGGDPTQPLPDLPAEHLRTLKPALPSTDRAILLKLLHLDLQSHPPPAPVRAIRLQAVPGDRKEVQQGLFSPQSPEPMRMDITLKRLAALVGENNVGSPRLLDTHSPDSFTMAPFSVVDNTPPGHITPAPEPRSALRRHRPPALLTVRDIAGRPAAFLYQSVWYTVAECFGPWQSSGNWWAASLWSLEEWDVRAESATGGPLLCILSRDTLRSQWRLEALYD